MKLLFDSINSVSISYRADSNFLLGEISCSHISDLIK